MSRAIHELALPFYGVVDLSGDVALQAADGLHLGVALGHLLGDILLCPLVGPEPSYGYDVDGGVGLPVAASVQPPVRHARRHGDGGHAAEHGEGRLGFEPLGVVARRHHQLRRGLRAHALAPHQQRRRLGQYLAYHVIELGDLVVQVDVALGQPLQGYLGGAERGLEVGRVGPRRHEVPDQLHARHAAQLVPEFLGGGYYVGPYHLEGDAPGGNRCRPGLLQYPKCFDHAVAALRGDGPRAGERRFRGHLRVDEVVLAALPSHRLVGEGHLEHGEPVLCKMPGQAAAVRPRAFDAHPEHLAERPRPGLQLAVSLPRRGERPLVDQRALPVHGRRHVNLLVRVDADDHLPLPRSLHIRLLCRKVCVARSRRAGCRTGQ